MKRHLGKILNTDQKCVVVFLQIPNRDDHALIVQTDSLTPRFEQALMEIVESNEGQADATLANVLNRRLLPETGLTVLQSLHNAGLLVPVHIDNVVMLPKPNMPFPLRQIIEGMGKNPPPPAQEFPVQEKFNPVVNNINARTAEEKLAVARNLLMQAEDLSAEAARKFEQAYSIAPELRPTLDTTRSTTADLEKIVAETTTKKAKRTSTRSKAKASKEA